VQQQGVARGLEEQLCSRLGPWQLLVLLPLWETLLVLVLSESLRNQDLEVRP